MSSELLTPELESIINIAENINKLNSHISQAKFPATNFFIESIKIYCQTFGKEAFAYLENKVDLLIDKYKFTGEKPDKNGLREIEKLITKINKPRQDKFDKLHGHYDPMDRENELFYISEKEEIAVFTNKSSMALSEIQSNWNVNNPNSPMKFGNLPYEIGSPEHRKNQLETLEKQSLSAGINHGALKNTEFNNLTSLEKEHFENSNKSSLEKINDHFEKNSTLEPNGSLRVKGLAELNRKLNEGKPFFGDILEFALTHDHLPSDAEIAKMPKQGQTPPLERRNFNSKEKIMSDQLNTDERVIRPSLNAAEVVAKEEAFTNALHQRKMVLNALKTGTLDCLPGKDGFADTKPAVNVVSGDFYHGINMLDLKDHQKQNGFPTAEYITENMLNKAKEAYPDLKIDKDQQTKGIFIHWEEKNGPDEWERKSVKLYNIAQTTSPEQLKTWAEQRQQEDYQKYSEYKKKIDPNWEPPAPKQKDQGPVIQCTGTDPEKYLGQYLAAVSMGGKFKATPEQAAEFSEKFNNSLTELKENGYPDPFRLSKINNAASKYSKDVIREMNMTLAKEKYQEQHPKQEQQQSRGGIGM